MSSHPATAELADKAGIGPEGHRRTSSVESTATDATLVDNEEPGLDAGAKVRELDHAAQSPVPRVPKRVTSVSALAAHSAKRGRVTAEAALGAPVGLTTTTNDAEGSPAAAAPDNISSFTATALAVADNIAHKQLEPDKASKTDDKEKPHLTPANRNASGTTSGSLGDDAAAPVSSSAALSPSVCDQSEVNEQATPPRRKPPRALGLQAPPSPTITAATLAALDAITGGGQASSSAEAIDWAAVAASAKPFNVPPASQTAQRFLGPAPQSDPQPLSPMLAGHVHLVNSVSLGWPGIDADFVAERHLHAEAAEFRGKVIGLMADGGGHANWTSSTSQEEDDEEDRQAILEEAVQEANLADLELYKDDEQASNRDDDDDESFNPEWLN